MASLLDDGVCEVVHQAAGPVEALPVRGERVQAVRVYEDLLLPSGHQGTEFQDGGNVFTGLPGG